MSIAVLSKLDEFAIADELAFAELTFELTAAELEFVKFALLLVRGWSHAKPKQPASEDMETTKIVFLFRNFISFLRWF